MTPRTVKLSIAKVEFAFQYKPLKWYERLFRIKPKEFFSLTLTALPFKHAADYFNCVLVMEENGLKFRSMASADKYLVLMSMDQHCPITKIDIQSFLPYEFAVIGSVYSEG